MAKSPFWLRGARGKFAGSVLQKGEKGTVIRENVKPVNPQTRNQMLTRIVFGTVATASAWLQRIVGQTFESADNEKINKRLFRKANISSLLNAAKRDAALGRAGKGTFAPKDVRVLTPNAYIISNGSLPLPEQLKYAYNSDDDNFITTLKQVDLTTGSYTAAELWAALVGLKAGQQATLVLIETQDGNSVAFDMAGMEGVPDEGYNILRYCDMSAARLVLLEGTGDTLNYVAGTTTIGQVLECMDSLVDAEKTAGIMWGITTPVGLAACLSLANNSMTFDGKDLIDEVSSSGYTIQACGVIISALRNSAWTYSRTVMAQRPPVNQEMDEPFENYNYGLKILDAIATYLSSSSTTSNKFTRQGGEEDAIGDSF